MAERIEIIEDKRFKEFCGVSLLTFNFGKDIKRLYEGQVKKRSGGRSKHDKNFCMCGAGKCFRSWSKKWLIISDHYVCYVKDSDQVLLHEVMMIDASFRIKRGYAETGEEYGL